MKKIICIALLMFACVSLSTVSLHSNTTLNFVPNETGQIDRVVGGVTHKRFSGQMIFNGNTSNQVMNYVGYDVKNDDDLRLITGDKYNKHTTSLSQNATWTWGMQPVRAMIEDINGNHKPYEVVVGVNADAYLISSTGQPVNPYIRDYRVISKSRSGSLKTLGIKDNGEIVIGNIEYGDINVNIYNEHDELKYQIKVDKINSEPVQNEVAVYFPDFDNQVPAGIKKHVFDVIEVKYDDLKVDYFGEGILSEITTEAVPSDFEKFIIAGDKFNGSLLDDGDYVIVQREILGDFKDVRHAMGMWHDLLENNEVIYPVDSLLAPRISVGITENNHVFFLLIDGRQSSDGMDGVTLHQLAHIMKYYGAKHAYNLDGGGSATMLMKNFENGEYEVLNSPSDKRERSVSNGFFIVTGNKVPRGEAISLPDNRTKLSTPEIISIDKGVLYFKEVPNASGYIINVNGIDNFSYANSFRINMNDTKYQISVKAKGNANYQTSDESEKVDFYRFSPELSDIFDIFKEFAKGEIQN